MGGIPKKISILCGAYLRHLPFVHSLADRSVNTRPEIGPVPYAPPDLQVKLDVVVCGDKIKHHSLVHELSRGKGKPSGWFQHALMTHMVSLAVNIDILLRTGLVGFSPQRLSGVRAPDGFR